MALVTYQDLKVDIENGSLRELVNKLNQRARQQNTTVQAQLTEVDPTLNNRVLLHHAISNFKSREIVKFLVESDGPNKKSLTHHDSKGWTPLQLAIRKCKSLPVDIIKYLFHAYLYSPTAADFAPYRLLEKKKFQTFDQQIGGLGGIIGGQDDHRFTAMHYAILYGAPEVTFRLLNAAWIAAAGDMVALPDSNQQISLLHLVILDPFCSTSCNRSAAYISTLLVGNTDEVKENRLGAKFCQVGLENKEYENLTPLHLAILCNSSLKVIQSLVGQAPPPLALLGDRDFRGETPLQLAIRMCKFLSADIVKYLFKTHINSSQDAPFDQYQLFEQKRFDIFEKNNLGSHVFIVDEHGFTALHYAILYNAPISVVKEIISKIQNHHLNPLHVASNAPISPLHLAILAPLRIPVWDRSPEYIVKVLLDADITSPKKSLTDKFLHVVTLNGDIDNLTPLQLAISCKSSANVISSLVDADTTGGENTVVGESSRNKDKEYPLLAAIKNQLPRHIVEILVGADRADAFGNRRTCINVVPYFCMGKLPNEYVSLIIDEHILSHLLYPKDVDLCQHFFPKTEEYSRLIPNKYYSDLAIIPAFQRHLSKSWCVTYAFAYLLLFDFYVYLMGLICFMWPWERGDKHWATILLGIIPGLLLAREVVEMNCSGFIRWMKRLENWLDALYAILILVCNFHIQGYAKGTLDSSQRNTILITSGLVWIMPILSLRIIFQPFALFVTGILNVSL